MTLCLHLPFIMSYGTFPSSPLPVAQSVVLIQSPSRDSRAAPCPSPTQPRHPILFALRDSIVLGTTDKIHVSQTTCKHIKHQTIWHTSVSISTSYSHIHICINIVSTHPFRYRHCIHLSVSIDRHRIHYPHIRICVSYYYIHCIKNQSHCTIPTARRSTGTKRKNKE